MVCAVAWADDGSSPVLGSTQTSTPAVGGVGIGMGTMPGSGVVGGQMLFTAGFDRRVYGWEISTVKEKE